MKFLHTADWQIGMKAAALGEAGARVREERLGAGRRVVAAAREHGAESVLVAGDLFEDNAVDRLLVQRVADILRAFPGPVFIIPGNHDPLVPGSVWEHPAWNSAGNIRVLREATPIDIPGGVLYPCPLFEKNSGRNPAAWIPCEDTGQIRIGLAHGTVEGVHQDEPDYPIPRDAAQRAGLDFLALGHWHSFAPYPDPDGAVRLAYSGTHEATRFGERNSGNVLVVEIPSAGVPPHITPVHTGGLIWIQLESEVRERGDLKALRERAENLTGCEHTLIEIVLSGLLTADESGDLEHLEQILHSRFLYGRLDSSRIRPSPEDDSWVQALPPGIIRDTAVRLRDHPNAPPEVAARALMELYAIAMEGVR